MNFKDAKPPLSVDEMASKIIVNEDRLHSPVRKTNLVSVLARGTSYTHNLMRQTNSVLA